MEGTWVPPSSLHDDRLRGLPNGELFNTITYGVRNMPGYAPEIEPVDRWRIILYVRALQMSQHAPKSELTPEIMSNMTP
jgi:hypothetical protein